MIEKADYCKDWNLKDIIINALETDGSHHKQWYLEQLLFKLGFDPNKIKEEEIKNDYDWDEGIAP